LLFGDTFVNNKRADNDTTPPKTLPTEEQEPLKNSS
jgi:hypothetical protein